jgi:hypothetical protein
MGKNAGLKMLARHLLAIACLTVGAAALAHAQVITEGTPPAPADFGNTFGAAFLLPDGTTQVNGSVELGSDTADFFTFQGLEAGSSFSFTATSTGNRAIGLDLFNSSDTQIGSSDLFAMAQSASGSGTVPTDGTLTLDLFVSGSVEGIRPYQVNLTATDATPEPGTLGAMGLGVAAGAVLWRRRRKMQIPGAYVSFKEEA